MCFPIIAQSRSENFSHLFWIYRVYKQFRMVRRYTCTMVSDIPNIPFGTESHMYQNMLKEVCLTAHNWQKWKSRLIHPHFPAIKFIGKKQLVWNVPIIL